MELPTWNRTRTKRKKRGPGADDDAFQASVRKSGRKAANHTRTTIGAFALVVVFVVGGVFFYNRSQTGAAEATRMLSTAVGVHVRAKVGEPETAPDGTTRLPPYPLLKEETERAERVAAALSALSEERPGSAADITAELVRGAEKIRLGNYDEAIVHYRSFIKNAPEDHPLAFLAREGLGFALEAKEDLEGALREFKILGAEKGAFYRDVALYNQGRILEALERSDDAIATYRQYNDEFPQTSMSFAQREVRARLEALDPAALAAPAEETTTPPVEDAAVEGAAVEGDAP
jgi:TolA-binding protein